MKNILLIIIVAISFSSFTKVDYTPIDLWEMVLSAEKIVYGEIAELREKDYTLKITSSVTGDKGNIVITRYNDWACSHRWAPYKVGQKVVVFLYMYNGKYKIMSAGGEGEIEVKGNKLNINSYIVGCDIKAVKPDLEITKFSTIIKQIRDCYGINKNLPFKKKECHDDNLYSDKNATSLYNCLKKEIEANFKR